MDPLIPRNHQGHSHADSVDPHIFQNHQLSSMSSIESLTLRIHWISLASPLLDPIISTDQPGSGLIEITVLLNCPSCISHTGMQPSVTITPCALDSKSTSSAKPLGPHAMEPTPVQAVCKSSFLTASVRHNSRGIRRPRLMSWELGYFDLLQTKAFV